MSAAKPGGFFLDMQLEEPAEEAEPGDDLEDGLGGSRRCR
jgi:hypothetical protein